MNVERARVEEKQGSLAQKIREAEEIKARGGMPPENLTQLRQERAECNAEMRRAGDKDYLRNRQRKREIRTKFEKLIDTLHCER